MMDCRKQGPSKNTYLQYEFCDYPHQTSTSVCVFTGVELLFGHQTEYRTKGSNGEEREEW